MPLVMQEFCKPKGEKEGLAQRKRFLRKLNQRSRVLVGSQLLEDLQLAIEISQKVQLVKNGINYLFSLFKVREPTSIMGQAKNTRISNASNKKITYLYCALNMGPILHCYTLMPLQIAGAVCTSHLRVRLVFSSSLKIIVLQRNLVT